MNIASQCFSKKAMHASKIEIGSTYHTEKEKETYLRWTKNNRINRSRLASNHENINYFDKRNRNWDSLENTWVQS